MVVDYIPATPNVWEKTVGVVEVPIDGMQCSSPVRQPETAEYRAVVVRERVTRRPKVCAVGKTGMWRGDFWLAISSGCGSCATLRSWEWEFDFLFRVFLHP